MALTGFFIPVKTVAKPLVFDKTETQLALQKESVIYKTDAQPIQKLDASNINKPANRRISKTLHEKSVPKTIPQETSGRNYSKEEVKALIIQYSEQYGISADLPLRVANCESGYNQNSKNKNSSASGVAQYIASTWKNTEAGRAGISVFDADANVHMMVKSIASGGIGNWNASKNCWNH